MFYFLFKQELNRDLSYTSRRSVMTDVIGLLCDFYESRKEPGCLATPKDKEHTPVNVEHNVLKLQSYNFVYNSCILTHYYDNDINYLHSLLKSHLNYCVCVNLNHLQYHHVVLDIDFKSLKNIDTKFVEKFILDLVSVIKVILNKSGLSLVMFAKFIDPNIPRNIKPDDLPDLLKKGVHFEIPECVLYRGDNIWFIEMVKNLIEKKHPHFVGAIDSPQNWNLPFSKKSTGEMYLPVAEYSFNSDDTISSTRFANTTIDPQGFINRFSIVKLCKNVRYEFPLNSGDIGYRFGVLNLSRPIFKDYRISTIPTVDDQPTGWIDIDPYVIPFVKYAAYRFRNLCTRAYRVGETRAALELRPFTLDFLIKEMSVLYEYHRGYNCSKSASILNTHILLVELYDEVKPTTYSMKEEMISTIAYPELKEYYMKVASIIKPLVQEIVHTHDQIHGSGRAFNRTLNPILFIKCLFTQSFTSHDRSELIIDETTGEPIYISNRLLQLINTDSVKILDLVKFMFPTVAALKDSSVSFYEKNHWIVSNNKYEHLYIPVTILNKYGIEDLGDPAQQPSVPPLPPLPPNEEDDEAPPTQPQKKTKKDPTHNLYQHLIKFWGRVFTTEFPNSVVSFRDGFVYLSAEHTPFHHTPLFGGAPSRLNWSNMIEKMKHVNQETCEYPNVVKHLVSTRDSARDSTIEYFRYQYKEEKGPTVACEDVVECRPNSNCPVYRTLRYLLTLFSNDVELVFFVLWIFRYALFGIKLKKALIFYGTGNNGKTTFSNILFNLFGRGMQTISNESIRGSINQLSPDIYAARNAKVVYTDDIHKINKNTLKQLVSGAQMQVRTLYQEGKSIEMKWLVTGSCNQLQLDIDFATMQRIMVVPFIKFFKDDATYYCNADVFRNIAEDMLATMLWIEKHEYETNIFFDAKKNIQMTPKSIQWYSHQVIWMHDHTPALITALGLKEATDVFILVRDLVVEMNKLRLGKTSKFGYLFNDAESAINMLKHRFSVARVRHLTRPNSEDAIVGITHQAYERAYSDAYMLE